MSRLLILLFSLALAACGAETSGPHAVSDKPMRIVSLDFCADNYVLKLADREQILALSPGASKGFAFMRDVAEGLPTVRPIAEDVLILKPDLVVRSYGGGPDAAAFFERAGVPVLQVGWASNIDGEQMGSISSLIQHMADGLGQTERGGALVTAFRERLDRISARPSSNSVMYMTPAGVTTGPGSLMHEVFGAAGLTNFETREGWHSLPLERLAYEQPDLVAASFFGDPTNHPNAWSATRHPVAKAQLAGPETVYLEGAWTACGGWYILEAVEALADGVAK